MKYAICLRGIAYETNYKAINFEKKGVISLIISFKIPFGANFARFNIVWIEISEGFIGI